VQGSRPNSFNTKTVYTSTIKSIKPRKRHTKSKVRSRYNSRIQCSNVPYLINYKAFPEIVLWRRCMFKSEAIGTAAGVLVHANATAI
jgi:hypothetical protein